MPKVNEPSRVIQRGKTRRIGEPRRPHEGAGTPATRAVSTRNQVPIGKPRSSDDGQGRFAQGEKREPAPRNVAPAPERNAPRTTAEPQRPLDRIAALESRVEELVTLLIGDGQPLAEGAPPPLLMRVEELEAVTAAVTETTGELVLTVGSVGTDDVPATGLVAALADLTLAMQGRGTVPAPPEAPTMPDAAEAPEGA